MTGCVEQNNSLAQRSIWEHQSSGEQPKPNFLAALEHGMLPASGIGIGIDRLCPTTAGLPDRESIHDAILFP